MLSAAVVEFVFRNWALLAIVGTVVTLIVVPASVLMKYVRIAINLMRTTKPPLSRSPLDFERIAGEPVVFPAFDGVPLDGMLVRAEPGVPRRGVVVFAHEFCSDMHSCARYCRPLLQRGFDIFTFNFRGHGGSEGEPGYTPRQWVTEREVNDIRGAVAYVQRWLDEQGLPREVGLFGISRGACASILIAAENPEIRALVCDGAFSTDSTIEWLMKRWAYIFASVQLVNENGWPEFWSFLRWLMMCFAQREFRCTFPSVRKAIMRMKPRPILFIHGEKDSYLPVEQSRLLYALAAEPKALWIAPGARHNQAAAICPETYARLTGGFLERYLAPAQAANPAPAILRPATRSAAALASVAAEQ